MQVGLNEMLETVAKTGRYDFVYFFRNPKEIEILQENGFEVNFTEKKSSFPQNGFISWANASVSGGIYQILFVDSTNLTQAQWLWTISTLEEEKMNR